VAQLGPPTFSPAKYSEEIFDSPDGVGIPGPVPFFFPLRPGMEVFGSTLGLLLALKHSPAVPADQMDS